MRIEAEVQRRVQERTVAPEFEAAIEEKLEAEVQRNFNLITVEIEMKKKKLIEEFRQKHETEEKSKLELENIIRTNQQRAQEQQQKFAQAQAMQTDDLFHERQLLQMSREQRKKKY